MIVTKPITQQQLDQKNLRNDVRFQENLNVAFDYVITDLMARIAELERKGDDNYGGSID